MNRLRTLGTLDLVDSGGNELRSILAQPKRAALLTYLAVATPRGSQRRDSLVALFWPEQDGERARAALNQAVHFLRRSLGAESIIARNATELGVDRDLLWCDAAAFEDELDAGHLSAAVDLYRGDLLDGFHIAGAPDFERWLAAERGRLAGRYTSAIETMADERESAGDFDGASALWRRLAARDLLSSRVTLRLMRALVAAGDPGGAVQHARVHETVLRNELNVPPDPQVLSFVRELQSERIAPRRQPELAADPSPAVRPSQTPKESDSEFVRANQRGPTQPDDARDAGVLASTLKHDPGPWSVVARWRHHAAMLIAGFACILAFGPATGAVDREAEVEELLARGRHAEQSRNPTGIETATRYYRRAIELDPDFAPAYAALSRVYALMAQLGYAPAQPALDSARLMATSAVARDARLPEAHTALAMSLGDGRDFDGAEREFLRAIEIDGNNAEAHYWYGILLIALGRAGDARREAELALELDPLSPGRGVMMMRRAATYLETGTRPPARWDSVDTLEPGEPWARRGHALDLAQQKKCSEARTEINIAERYAPDVVQMLFAIALIHRFCGEAERATDVMERLKRHPRAHDDGMWIAMTHAPFGELDSAFVWLDRQVWTTAELTDLRANRWLDSLRPDPRYAEVLERLGLHPR